MCCAIRKTCRSYLRTSVSYAEISPARTRATSATSGCCSFSAIGWMVAIGVGCGNSWGIRPRRFVPILYTNSVTDGRRLDQAASAHRIATFLSFLIDMTSVVTAIASELFSGSKSAYSERMMCFCSPLPMRIERRLFVALVAAWLLVSVAAAQTSDSTPPASSARQAAPKSNSTSKASARKSSGTTRKGGSRSRVSARHKRRPSARAIRIKRAFVASSELRPMAQQLATMRTPPAYAGVTSYAQKHTGDASAAAYLALGHAYLTDRRFAEATNSLRLARQSSDVLADYADFLAARSEHEAGNEAGAEALLHTFTQKYPESVFVVEAPELEATVLLAMHDLPGAQRVLAASAHTAAVDRPGYQLAKAQVELALGQIDESNQGFKEVLLKFPLSSEAETARARLTASGAEETLTAIELRSLGDAYYNAGRFSLAEEQYRALARHAGLPEQMRAEFSVAAAACELKLKRLTTAQAEALADTQDDNGARRSYLLMELARSRNDSTGQQSIVEQMKTRFPQSQWLAEALFSSGNMYLLSRDYAKAAEYYSYLAAHFPQYKNSAGAHWRAGWLNYRQGLYADAERIFDEQIRLYP